ncbi:receptor-like protein EIX2 [Gastrolobium bilobum]|uniref:receptor-like protein EIX2 n=1 Tax=Gastrolobium bilobum TaxID=150636 RepID=UPI002AB1EEE5|nr:receptor-like protein EIX2 [Gastrolobium bilobum]
MNPVCLKLIEAIFMVCLVLQVELACAKEVDIVYGKEDELVSSKVVRCIERERKALLDLKGGLVDDYGMLSSWTTADCCQWKGIRCSNLTGHVLMLDLHGESHYIFSGDSYVLDSQLSLSGKIHKSLMELQQLKYLNLSRNDFPDCHIPDFFGSLTNLRYLDLSYSSFGGKIPSQFGSLSQLKHLNLGGNSLEGSSIPSQLGNLSKLQYLDLSENSLEGNIPSEIGKLSNLQTLYLGGYDGGALKIDDGNRAGGQWLSNLSSLTHLHLVGISNLNRSKSWMQMIVKLPKLRELSLSDCSLSDHFILSLNGSKFNSSTSLSVIDLSRNTFTSSMIFQWVSNISSNLVELDLTANNLLEALPSSHFGIVMNSLERLYLSFNRLKDSVIKSFMNICTLRSLYLSQNNLTEELPSILLNMSRGCVRYSLQELNLRENQITGSLPDLSIFTSLKTLDLSSNRLSGKIPEGSRLPSFGDACTLRSLDLSNNSLSVELGVIFNQLSGCARYSLQNLYLEENKINGTLANLC